MSEDITIVERAQQIVTPEEVVLKTLNIDTRSVWLRRLKNWEMDLREDNSYIDEWGIRGKEIIRFFREKNILKYNSERFKNRLRR